MKKIDETVLEFGPQVQEADQERTEAEYKSGLKAMETQFFEEGRKPVRRAIQNSPYPEAFKSVLSAALLESANKVSWDDFYEGCHALQEWAGASHF